MIIRFKLPFVHCNLLNFTSNVILLLIETKDQAYPRINKFVLQFLEGIVVSSILKMVSFETSNFITILFDFTLRYLRISALSHPRVSNFAGKKDE